MMLEQITEVGPSSSTIIGTIALPSLRECDDFAALIVRAESAREWHKGMRFFQ